MRGWLVIATIIVLAMLTAPAAMATEAWWDVVSLGGRNVYSYVFMSTEDTDVLKSFHVYASINPSDVIDWSADEGWSFSVSVDSESGAADLCWSADDPEGGLLSYEFLQVSISTATSLSTNENYILMDYLGNWGYNTLNFANQYPTVMDSTVGVPTRRLTETPEPASLLALASGCAMLWFRRRN